MWLLAPVKPWGCIKGGGTLELLSEFWLYKLDACSVESDSDGGAATTQSVK